jgi:hypothetical protein
LSTGEWLLPTAVWSHRKPFRHSIPHEQFANVTVSSDDGETFSLRGSAEVPNHHCEEHMIVERRDGSLWMLVRRRDGIGEAVSTDRGRTWTASANAVLAGPCSRFHIRRLASGRLLLLNHLGFTGRSHLTAMLSDDDGLTWPHRLLLDGRADVSYPDAVQAPDGRIFAIYDRQRVGTAEIILQVFSEDDILACRNPGHTGGRVRVLSRLARPDIGSRRQQLGDPVLHDQMNGVMPRADGVHAAAEGVLSLKPFRYTGTGLYLSCAVQPGGAVRVQLEDWGGRPAPGRALDDCCALTHDATDHLVHWQDGSDVSMLAGQLVRLRFSLTRAQLCSLQFR